uniref:NADH-ubiquinone oxidoreductase chain 2 n=1 Tax=Longipodacrangonyx sp. 1 MDMBR-2012 TaxID=1200665 RepID=K7ZWW2_9CRUS|nr:NADH dehydrogenase subunit 2 [Longipodacrangonyx sp. 1 MDMBR-2012]
MFFHPSIILFNFFLVFSVIMIICMNSWFMIWFFIEMNLLFFIPLIMTKKSKYSVEAGLKYFFIQTLSSILILIGLLLLFLNLDIYNFFFVSGLGIKLGLVPFHQWVVNIVSSMNWSLIWMLLTIQKFGPFMLFSYMYTMSEDIEYLVYVVSIGCAIVGSLGGLFTSSLHKIMAFSSISHSSWMTLSLVVSVHLLIIYFIFYSVILFSVLYVLGSHYLSSLNHIFLKLDFSISLGMGVGLLSMGGMPPFSGFIPKFIVMIEFISLYNYFVLIFLLFGVFVSLFFYSRMFIFNFIFLSSKNLFFYSSKSKMNIVFYVNMVGLLMIPLSMYMY